MDDPTVEIYAGIGSDQPFYDLVEAFYQGVENEPILRSLYPADLTESKKHLALFLIQRFGGHSHYAEERGHPRLRMRHVPFTIGQAESDAWLRTMFAAVDAIPAFEPYHEALHRYFADAAAFLINKTDVPAVIEVSRP